MKKVLQIENIKTIGTVYSDELICRRLGIEIPTLVPSDRVAATKILSNFQTKKAVRRIKFRAGAIKSDGEP